MARSRRWTCAAALAAAGVIGLAAAALVGPAPAGSAVSPSAEQQLNLHYHGIGVRVARTPLPGGGVPVRVVPLPAATPDVVERLRSDRAELRDGSGGVVPLQRMADTTLVGVVPAAWVTGSGLHQLQLVVWSGPRRIAAVSIGYLLP